MINFLALPLYINNLRDYIFGEESFLIQLPGAQIYVRPRSYDLYVVGETFYEKSYLPTLEGRGAVKPEYVVDLGAYIGDFTVWAATEFKPKHIYAVEFLPEHVELIRKNIALNGLDGITEVIEKAIYSKHTTVKVRVSPVNKGKSSITSGAGSLEVGTITLKEIVDMIPTRNIDFLKIDIEGAERDLFNKDNETLFRDNASHISMELHFIRPKEIAFYVDYLKKLNYEVKITSQLLRFRACPNLEGINRNKLS